MLTRTAVIDVRELVTVAEITSTMRGLAAEVSLDHEAVGLDRPSAVNCDELHTFRRSSLTDAFGTVEPPTLDDLCAAVVQTLGCWLDRSIRRDQVAGRRSPARE